MRFDKVFKPWEACAQDDARPILNYVLVTTLTDTHENSTIGNYNAVMVSTDGFQMTVIPCYLENTDLPGLIHGPVLKDICSNFKGKYSRPELLMSKDMFSINSGQRVWRNPEDESITPDKFPDWRNIFDRVYPLRLTDTAHNYLAYQQTVLDRIQKALGAKYYSLYPTRPSRPVAVVPDYCMFKDHLTFPLAILMPAGLQFSPPFMGTLLPEDEDLYDDHRLKVMGLPSRKPDVPKDLLPDPETPSQEDAERPEPG